MESQGLKKDDVRHFVLHSAGRRVIEQAEKLLDLTDDQLAHSRHVLRAFGNMSSATVVFVLEEALRAGAPRRRRLGPHDRARPRLRCRGRAAALVACPSCAAAARGRGRRRASRRPPRRLATSRVASADVARLNGLFGGRLVTLRHVRRLLARFPPDRAVTVLDLGTGSADIPRALVRWARRAGPVAPRNRAGPGRRHPVGRRGGPPPAIPRSPSCGPMPSRCPSGRARWTSPSPRSRCITSSRRRRRHAWPPWIEVARAGLVVNDLTRSRAALVLVWLATRALACGRHVAPRRALVREARLHPREVRGLCARRGLRQVEIRALRAAAALLPGRRTWARAVTTHDVGGGGRGSRRERHCHSPRRARAGRCCSSTRRRFRGRRSAASISRPRRLASWTAWAR